MWSLLGIDELVVVVVVVDFKLHDFVVVDWRCAFRTDWYVRTVRYDDRFSNNAACH